MSTNADTNQTHKYPYTSTVDAEPIHRYQPGGYHPVILGDVLKAGRNETLVAVKISTAESKNEDVSRELQTVEELASHRRLPDHVVRMLDAFELTGPNGVHHCLVYELLGPNVPDTIDFHFQDGRLPGKLAKTIAKQCLIGLHGLHQRKICHGDLHTRNLAFALPSYMDTLSEEKLLGSLEAPEIGYVQRLDGEARGRGVPEYLVWVTSHRLYSRNQAQHVKIIDFGQSFAPSHVPVSLHTPLCLRAPEVIFKDRLDYRVDLWSLGCLLFELFTGQPPFDSIMTTPTILVGQMREMATGNFRERWQTAWERMDVGDIEDTKSSASDLQEWLEEVYFENQKKADLTPNDIVKLGQIIRRLLCFEPSARASASEILADPWFDE